MHTPPPHETWPHAVRAAELLRGTLVRCGPGVRPIGYPESPRQRLIALAPWLEDRIACGATAAWVWGARAAPGHPLHCATHGRRRPPPVTPPGVVVHQLTLGPADVVELSGRFVTSAMRTAVDLLKGAHFDRADRASVRLLALQVGADRALLREAVARSSRNERALASARIGEL